MVSAGLPNSGNRLLQRFAASNGCAAHGVRHFGKMPNEVDLAILPVRLPRYQWRSATRSAFGPEIREVEKFGNTMVDTFSNYQNQLFHHYYATFAALHGIPILPVCYEKMVSDPRSVEIALGTLIGRVASFGEAIVDGNAKYDE